MLFQSQWNGLPKMGLQISRYLSQNLSIDKLLNILIKATTKIMMMMTLKTKTNNLFKQGKKSIWFKNSHAVQPSAPQSVTFNNKKMWIMVWLYLPWKAYDDNNNNKLCWFSEKTLLQRIKCRTKGADKMRKKKPIHKFKWKKQKKTKKKANQTRKQIDKYAHTLIPDFACNWSIQRSLTYHLNAAFIFERKKMSINKMKRRFKKEKKTQRPQEGLPNMLSRLSLWLN